MSPDELKTLTSIAEALNTKSNELNALIASFNAKLNKMNLGIEEWLLTDEYHFQIGYAKVGDSWQLAVRHCTEIRAKTDAYGDEYFEPVPGAETTVIPLLQAPRELRIEALDCMGVLLSQLTRSAQAKLNSIETAEKMIAAL